MTLGQKYDKGAEWFRIANLDRVWVLADLLESDAELARPGATARVTGTRSVFAERAGSGFFLDVEWDRDALARHGLMVGEAQAVLSSAVGGDDGRHEADRAADGGQAAPSFVLELVVYPAIYRTWRWHGEVKATALAPPRDDGADALAVEVDLQELAPAPVVVSARR